MKLKFNGKDISVVDDAASIPEKINPAVSTEKVTQYVTFDIAAASAVLKHFGPDTLLCHKHPDREGMGALRGNTALTDAAEWNAKGHSIYFAPNSVLDGLKKKPADKEIVAINAVYGDFDWDRTEFAGRFDEGLAALTERLIPALKASSAPPSLIWFTGGGCQAAWLFRSPIGIEHRDAAMNLSKAIQAKYGGDPVSEISRILRLPGFTNYPKKAKRDAGQRPALAKVIFTSDHKYTLEELEAAFPRGDGIGATTPSKPSSWVLPEAFKVVPPHIAAVPLSNDLAAGIAEPVDPIKLKEALEAIPLEVLAEEGHFFDIYTATANETHKHPEQKEELYAILDARFAKAANYNGEDNRARFERFLKEAATYTGKPLGIGSIYKLAGEHGWKETPFQAQSTTGEAPETDDSFDNFPIPKSFDAATMVPRGFGVFDDIYEHILASSILPQPVYSVGAAIITASAIIGNRFNIEDSGGLRLNLYGSLIGGTTSNKTDPIKAAVRIVKECERKYFASATGTAAVQDKVFANAGGVGGVVQLLDEAAPIFSTMGSKNKNPYAIGLLETYLDLFSKSNGFYVERAFARDRQAKPGVTAARVAKIVAGLTPTNLIQPTSALSAGIVPPALDPAVLAAIQAAMTDKGDTTREIENPFLSACWVSTPTLLGAALENDMASAGLLNRILTFVSDNDDPDGRIGAFRIPDIPDTIVKWAADVEKATHPKPSLADTVAGITKTWGCQKIAITSEVQGILDDRKIRNTMLKWAKRQRNAETAKDVVARATELILKVAGILAVCRDWRAPVIDSVALTSAMMVVGWCLQRLFNFVERNIADSPDEKIVNRIRVFLENAVIQDAALPRADRGWVSRSALLRKSKLLARRLDEILGTMVDAGDLARRELFGDAAQKPTTQYRRSGRTR